MRNFSRIIKESVLIIIIASIIGVFINIQLIKKYINHDFNSEFIFFDENLPPQEITIYEAEELFQKGNALFIDARSKEEFKKGHILGAINIPLNSITSSEDLKNIKLPEDKLLITYCEGGDCKLSFYLAYYLQKAGYVKVKVLAGGWLKWLENGLPWNKD
jgi:rhodanese-related sulfurtransferase